MFRRVTVLGFLCKNACFLYLCICSVCSCGVCSVAADLKFDLLLCWEQHRACDVSSMKDRDRDRPLNWDRHTNATAHYLSWNCSHFLGELETAFTGISCIFKGRYCNETTLFEQLRAVPPLCQVWSCLLTLFHSWLPLWMWKFQSENLQMPFFFSQERKYGKGEQFWNGSWCCVSGEPGESCCTCQGPFVQLSLHSAADALHTLAGVKCCQAHLWPSVKGHDLRVCSVTLA